ncbi:MAG: hypothetical protein ACREAM_17675 [Blastocatellia bacterium]
MEKKLKSRDSNLKRSAPSTLVAAIFLCVAFECVTGIFAQPRLGRPPTRRELEGTPILAAGTSVIPDGTILLIEMDTRLDSGTAQVSDRFLARIATPVVDAGGRTLLQAGTIVEGHVASVKKAKWGHRSGELGLSFDYIEFGDGRRIPLRGTLVSGSNPIDDEGDLRAKSAIKRDVLVTTGGAVAGAGVGMVTGGSILAGGGVGAAAGLTVVLVMKGKNVEIDPGERFNLQLVQPMSLTSTISSGQRVGIGTRPGGTRPLRPLPLQSRTGTGTLRQNPGATDPYSVRTVAGPVSVYDARAERDRDGMLRVQIRTETPTNGWRIYTHHQIQPGDTLDVRVRGFPPSTSGTRQVSRPSASEICVDDRNSAIRRIVVRGSNGDRYLTIGQGTTSAQLDPFSRPSTPDRPIYQPTPRPNPQTGRPRPGAGPSDGSLGNLEFPPSTRNPSGSTPRPTSSLSSLATQVANQVEVLRSNYAAAIGVWVNNDGTIDPSLGRTPTAGERQLFETLSYMHNSARALAAPSLNAFNRQRSAQQLQSDNQTAQQMWQRVRSTGVISPELDRQWNTVQNNVRALLTAASR